MMKRTAFRIIFGCLLGLASAIGIEAVAWLATPPWPGYLLRPAPVGRDAEAQWSRGMPEVSFATNSWQMRDRERSVTKPGDVSFRALFVGDSFLEGGFT